MCRKPRVVVEPLHFEFGTMTCLAMKSTTVGHTCWLSSLSNVKWIPPYTAARLFIRHLPTTIGNVSGLPRLTEAPLCAQRVAHRTGRRHAKYGILTGMAEHLAKPVVDGAIRYAC